MKSQLLQTAVAVVLPAVFAISAALGADKAAQVKPAGGELQMMDTNGDGKISREEHLAGAKKMFALMDANKDGKVTAAEMDAAHDRMMKTIGKSPKDGAMHMSSADKIKAVDTNGDGVLSADEHAAGAKMMFDKMDTDKDGFLSQSELEAGHARMMSKTAAK